MIQIDGGDSTIKTSSGVEYKKKVETLQRITAPVNAATCYALQGATIGHRVVVMNAGSKLISSSWLFVAITRVQRFEDLVFCFDDAEDFALRRGIPAKVVGYKAQDRAAGREKNDLTEEGVMRILLRYRVTCCYCRCCPGASYVLDRTDPSLPHNEANLCVACPECNARKGAVEKS